MPKKKYSKKDNGLAKALLVIAGILTILSVLFYFFDESLGSWWHGMYDSSWDPLDYHLYVNAFGTFQDPASNDLVAIVEGLGILVGIFALAAGIVFIYGATKESKGISLLALVLLIGGIALFLYGLNQSEPLNNWLNAFYILSGGDEYNVYFGVFSLGAVGDIVWGLGIGMYIAIASAVIGIIGIVKL